MTSKTAKIDIEALIKDGYKPTIDEIIRLNDLGVSIEMGKETTPANYPRMGFAGNVVLFEPTIGAILWWEEYGSNSTINNKGKILTYFFMLAHSRRIDVLEQLTKPKDIRKAVKEWAKNCGATEKELWRACMYVKFGTKEVEEEYKAYVDSTIEQEERMNHLWNMLIAVSGATNINPEDLKTKTQSTLTAMLIQANIRAGVQMKPSIARDYIAYNQLLKQIEERGTDDGK